MDGLLVVGQDLFCDGLREYPAYSDFSLHQSLRATECLQTAEDMEYKAQTKPSSPKSEFLTPNSATQSQTTESEVNLELDVEQLHFETKPGQSIVKRMAVRNTGTTSVYCSWSERNHTNGDVFHWSNDENVILPGENHVFTFHFKAKQTGLFLKEFSLRTKPNVCGSFILKLEGKCTKSDVGSIERGILMKTLKNRGFKRDMEDLIHCLVAGVKPREIPESEMRKLFYDLNKNPQLYYYREYHKEFLQLSQSMISSFRRRRRNQAIWDYKVQTLKDWLVHLEKPLRLEFHNSIVNLEQKAMRRPTPNPQNCEIMSQILMATLNEIPVLSFQAKEQRARDFEEEKRLEALEKENAKREKEKERERQKLEKNDEDEEEDDEEDEENEEEEEEDEEVREQKRRELEISERRKAFALLRKIFASHLSTSLLRFPSKSPQPFEDRKPWFYSVAFGWVNFCYECLPLKLLESSPMQDQKISHIFGNAEHTLISCTNPSRVWLFTNKEPDPSLLKSRNEKEEEEVDEEDEEEEEESDEEEEEEDEEEKWKPEGVEIEDFREFKLKHLSLTVKSIYAVTTSGALFKYDKESKQLQNVMCNTKSICMNQTESVGFIIQENRVLSFGTNMDLLGVEEKSEEEYQTILESENIIDIQIGTNHCCALASDGGVFSWGAGGASGLKEPAKIPTKLSWEDDETMSDLSNIQSVITNSYTTMVLTNDGKVYEWGQLSCTSEESEIKESAEPQRIPFDEKITSIACGKSHFSCVTETGAVYSWGSGASKSLGISALDDEPDVEPGDRKVKNRLSPIRLSFAKDFEVKTVRAFHNSTIFSTQNLEDT